MNPYSRTALLLGDDAMEKLKNAKVAVFGLGGVGGYVVEALARSGVGALELIDHDTISITNINRQLEALTSTVGMAKSEAVAARIREINPEAILHPMQATYNASHRDLFFPVDCHYDYIVDAIDLVSCKLDLLETARRLKIPLIMALGTGNKLDPSQLRLADISETSGCPLARVMRKELRNRGILHQTVVFSPEKPAPTTQLEAPPPGRRSVPASNPWVPATAGLLLGSAVVRDILAKGTDPSC